MKIESYGETYRSKLSSSQIQGIMHNISLQQGELNCEKLKNVSSCLQATCEP